MRNVANFTPAEIEVLKLIIKGYSNKEICNVLNVAMTTVKTHVTNLYSKAGINREHKTDEFAVQRVRLVLKYQDIYK